MKYYISLNPAGLFTDIPKIKTVERKVQKYYTLQLFLMKEEVLTKESKTLHPTSVLVYLHHKTTIFSIVYVYFNVTLR